PPDLGGLETVAGPVIGNVAAVVIAAVRGLRPAVIAAGQDEVHLIAAHRTHFGLPQAAIRSESKPQQIAMAERIMMTDALALGRHMNDLTEIDVGILRGRELETLATGDEHGPVRGECDALRIMRAAFDLGLLPPNRPETFQVRLALSEYQARIADSCTAGSIRASFGKAQINALVAGKIGMRDNLGKTALPLDMDSGNTRDLL